MPGRVHPLPDAGVDAPTIRRRSAWAELVGVWLAVSLPLLVIAGYLMAWGLEDVSPGGDEAVLELAVLNSPDRIPLVGLGSPRLGLHHPGPVYFYLLLPLHRLYGCHYLGIVLTVVSINLAAVTGVLVVVARCWGRVGMIWTAVLLTLYLRMLTMPTMVEAWTASVLLGSFLVQTHLVYAPSVIVAGAIALAVCWSPRMRIWLGLRQPRPANLLRVFIFSVALLLLLWTPPLVEQFGSTPGNMTRILCAAGQTPCRGWCETFSALADAMAAFPRTLVVAVRGAELFRGLPVVSGAIAVAQVVLLMLVWRSAWRRGDDYGVATAIILSIVLAVSAASIRRMPGQLDAYLLGWITGLSVLIFAAAGNSLAQWLGKRLAVGAYPQRRRIAYALSLGAILLGTAANLVETAREVDEIRSVHDSGFDLRPLVSAAVDRLQREGVRHYRLKVDEDVWPAAAGLALQLTKSGHPPTLSPRWAFVMAPGSAREGSVDGTLVLCRPTSRSGSKPQPPGELLAETTQVQLYWAAGQGVDRRFLP